MELTNHNWRRTQRLFDGDLVWVNEINTPDGWLLPDCCFECDHCGACLGCICPHVFRKNYDGELEPDESMIRCPNSPTGFHELSDGKW